MYRVFIPKVNIAEKLNNNFDIKDFSTKEEAANAIKQAHDNLVEAGYTLVLPMPDHDLGEPIWAKFVKIGEGDVGQYCIMNKGTLPLFELRNEEVPIAGVPGVPGAAGAAGASVPGFILSDVEYIIGKVDWETGSLTSVDATAWSSGLWDTLA